MELYHTELGFPKNVDLPSGIFNLSYSHHAQNASYDDRYGQMHLPDTLNVDDAKLIEIEVENNQVVKGVYRINYSDDLDLITTEHLGEVEFTVTDDKHTVITLSDTTEDLEERI